MVTEQTADVIAFGVPDDPSTTRETIPQPAFSG
jgi:hypothetical protein